MSQNDRRESLNMGFDALMDLVAVLQIEKKDISYGGILAIAFGARGSGNAYAHYEPMRKVINLTKMNGAGSLAHEWWHGLDDFIGEKMGVKGLLSESPSAYPLMQKLIDTMKYKPETIEQAIQRREKLIERGQRNAKLCLENAVLSAIKSAGDEEALSRYEELKTAFLNGESGSVNQLNDLKKSVTGRGIPKDERERLLIYEHMISASQGEVKIDRVNTDYFTNSQRMGKECEKDGGYWESNTEMTARAFATYIMDKLPGRSDYLAGHAECAITFVTGKDGKTEILRAYPQGEERKAINAVFDDMIEDLKQRQILSAGDMKAAHEQGEDSR